MLRKADDPEAAPETLQRLQNITNNCDVCQRLASQPGRFRVSLPNDVIVSNRTIIMDLMSLSSKSVLHIICKDTLLSAAVFASGERSLDLWNDYVQAWANPYAGRPNIIHADYGPQFRSDE